MGKGYFSESAKTLARSNGINVSDIYTHRDDGLATVDNVKCAILKRHKEGFLVQLQVGIVGINPTKTNMELIKKWYKKHAESAKYVVDVSDIKVFVVPTRITDPTKPPKHPPMTIQIDYRLHYNRRSEVEFANGFIVDPDDDGNYPIYVKNGKITSINVGDPNGGEAILVVGKVINSRVVPLNGNNFGKNVGVAMMGSPIPFKRR